MKKFQGSLRILFILLFFSCKDSLESRKEVEFILDTFTQFYNVNQDSRILILSNFSNKNNTYDLRVINIENIDPPYNYLSMQTLKSNYKTYTIFYSSSSQNYLLSNQLSWSVYIIKKQNEEESLDENQPWYDFKELRFSYKKGSDSIKVIPPIGESYLVMYQN